MIAECGNKWREGCERRVHASHLKVNGLFIIRMYLCFSNWEIYYNELEVDCMAY